MQRYIEALAVLVLVDDWRWCETERGLPGFSIRRCQGRDWCLTLSRWHQALGGRSFDSGNDLTAVRNLDLGGSEDGLK